MAFYDTVLVMSDGRIVEEGSPLALLEAPGSAFRAMAHQTGEFDLLLSLVREAQQQRERERRRGGKGWPVGVKGEVEEDKGVEEIKDMTTG